MAHRSRRPWRDGDEQYFNEKYRVNLGVRDSVGKNQELGHLPLTP
jgi:hypothetical protein